MIMAAFAALYAVERVANRYGVAFPWARAARAAIAVQYWIHVELVYGYATWPIHRRLPLVGRGAGVRGVLRR